MTENRSRNMQLVI